MRWIAALLLAAAMPAHADVTCSFDAGVDCGFELQARDPSRASLVPTARDGATALRLVTQPGDRDIAGSGRSERADVYLAHPDGSRVVYGEGVEQWWAHSIYLPDDFQAPTWHQYVLADFHNTTAGNWQANFMVQSCRGALDTTPGRLCFKGYGGASNAAGEYGADIGPMTKNVYHDLVYHVRWSAGSGGFMDAWAHVGNEPIARRVLSHQGPTLYTGQGVYLKLANYHVPICDPYPACVGTHLASAVIHDRVILGTGPEVSLVPLEGLPGSPPSCTVLPPPVETRTQACPVGTTGTWSQSRSYASSPYPVCWAAGGWLPPEPLTGVCLAPPPSDPCVVSPLARPTNLAWPTSRTGSRTLRWSSPNSIVRVDYSWPIGQNQRATWYDNRGCSVTVAR